MTAALGTTLLTHDSDLGLKPLQLSLASQGRHR